MKGYKILNNQNIYDIANITLGGFDNIYAGLILVNASIDSINKNLNTIATSSIVFNEMYYNAPVIDLQLNIPKKSTVFYKTGLQNQSIYDLALMNYGSLENIYKLIVNNKIISINELDVSFKTIKFDTTDIIDLFVKDTLNKKKYVFNTFKQTNNKQKLFQNNDLFEFQDGTAFTFQ